MTQMIAITKKIPEIASNIRKLHSNTGNKVTRRIMTRGFEIRTFCLIFLFYLNLKRTMAECFYGKKMQLYS